MGHRLRSDSGVQVIVKVGRIVVLVVLYLSASACTRKNSGIFAGPVTGVVVADDCVASGPTFFNDQGQSGEKTCFVRSVGHVGQCVRVVAHTPAVNTQPPYRFPVDSSSRINSKGFELSVASADGGRPTPLDAAAHLRVPGVSVPSSDWLIASADSTGTWVLSGRTYVHAVQGSDGTWQADQGMVCG